MNNTTTKHILRWAYNALAWSCTILVIALSIHSAITDELPIWLATTIVVILGTMTLRAIYVTALTHFGIAQKNRRNWN